jgi:hypothetical protein
MAVVVSSGDITGYRSFGGGDRDPVVVSGTTVQQDSEGAASTAGDRWAGPEGMVLQVLSVKKAEEQWWMARGRGGGGQRGTAGGRNSHVAADQTGHALALARDLSAR